MKILSKTLQFAALFFLITASSCKQDRYPELPDGLYAEFVTNKDTMVAKLFFKKVPVTVANFVALAEGNHPLVKEEYKNKKYYNGTTFHRVINNFMIQGGDPTATGTGDPGYKFEDEFHPELKHDKPGILSMANSGPNTNGSQFFITERATPHLDAYLANGNLKECGAFPGGGCHSVFGELVYGLDVLDSISNVETGVANKPIEDVVIIELNIIRKGSEAKAFDAPKVFTEELPKLKERQEKLREETRKKAEEERKVREAKSAAAAKEIKPVLDDYLSKATSKPSGLKTYFITKGNGPKPNQGDEALVNYEGYFEDGKLFDSNIRDVAERHGQLDQRRVQANMYGPVPMKIGPDAQLIAGMKEALADMRVGDKLYAYIPYHLAYGERQYGPIPGKSNLLFIIEMTGIK